MLEDRFRRMSRVLLEKLESLELSAECSTRDRAVAHQVADEMGLKHESVGGCQGPDARRQTPNRRSQTPRSQESNSKAA